MSTDRTFSYKEEFEEFVKFENFSALQISPGLFYGTISSIKAGSLVLDRKTIGPSNVQKFEIPTGEICLFFPNREQEMYVNGRLISSKSQIAMFSEEPITALVPRQSDVNVASFKSDVLASYIPLDILNTINKSGEKVRRQPSNNKLKQRIHTLLKSHLPHTKPEFDATNQLHKDILDNIYFNMANYLESFDLSGTLKKKDKLSLSALRKLKIIIMRKEVISLSDLTRGLHITPRTFNNLVKKHFNCTPQQLIAIVRLNQIRKYLKESSLNKKTIKHISSKFGISNPVKMTKDYELLFGEKIQQTIYLKL